MLANTQALSPRVSHRAIFTLTLTLLTLLTIGMLNPFLTSALALTSSHTPSLTPARLKVLPNKSACLHSGVVKNANGGYHFSWLHVDPRTGYIMDERNCIVDLHGFNTAGTEFADAVSPFTGLTSQRLIWFNSMFKMNYIRLNLNVGWWNSDVYVPNAQMRYRAWIEQWIRWAEQSGDYVLLNRTNEYQLPPCGGNITYCPAQGELSDIDDGNLQKQFNSGHLLDQTLAFWRSIGTLYRNDPAILYDDWNEMHDINAQSWFKVQTTLISTIRSINPRSLIMLGSNDWNNTMNPLTNGQVPDLRYPNLVYDWHIYGGGTAQGCTQGTSYMWSHWGAESARQFTFAHQHGHGAIINEWGGCIDAPAYNNALSKYAASNHIGMAYYMAGNVVNGSWNAINANGILAQAAYARFSN